MRTCPLRRADCDLSDMQLTATRIREGEGRIVKCPRCQLVMQYLDWSADDIERYYNTVYQNTNSLVSGQSQTAREHFEDRIKTIQPIFQHVKTLFAPSMRVLDVGCGAGELLSLIQPLVQRCVGVEMNREFTDFIQADLGIEAHAGDIMQLDLRGDFDLIICVDSLDHMPNPLDVLMRMRSLLAPNGAIWLTVPNLNEALNHFLPEPNLSRYRQFFWHRAHFFYFSAETLTTMLDAAGLDVVEIKYYHQYTLKNYLKWYFTGQPQPSYAEASTGVSILPGTDLFAVEMNAMFAEMERRFQEILRQNGRGDTLWCHAVPRAKT